MNWSQSRCVRYIRVAVDPRTGENLEPVGTVQRGHTRTAEGPSMPASAGRRKDRREGVRAGAGAQAGPAMARTPGDSTYASVFLRERVLGVSAVWPSESGRMASGFSPYGVSSFYTPRLGDTVPG